MNRIHLRKYLLLILGSSLLPGTMTPAPAKTERSAGSLRGLRLLAVGSWSGDAGFRRRLMRDMNTMGFRWVPRSQAQGIVSARTSWKRGGFTGEMWIRDRAGRVLWHESAYRAPSSNSMAGEQLASKLRSALRR